MTTTASIVSGTESWPRKYLEKRLRDPQLALRVLVLYLQSSEWIHRRLHQVVFQGEKTVRHCFSIDLTVPDQAPVLSTVGSQEILLLPLDLLRKQNIVNFKITDQDGRSLSYFTRSQLGCVTSTMLIEYAGALLDRPLPDSVAKLVQDLVTCTPAKIEEARSRWEKRTFIESEAQVVKSGLDKLPEFRFLLDRLMKNYLLLVPTDSVAGARLHISYCFDLPLKIEDARDDKERFLEGLGWDPTRVDFRLEAASGTESYHFEVEDPPGVDLVKAAIVEYPAPVKKWEKPKPIFHEQEEGGLPTLNLHASGVQRGSRVVAHVDVQAGREPWLSFFMISCFVLAALLFLGAWRLPSMLTPQTAQQGAAQVQVGGMEEVTAALLIFLAGVIATLMSKSDPRGILRKILYRLRELGMATAVMPIIAVTVLLFFPSGNLLRWTWSVLGGVAVLAGLVASRSLQAIKISSTSS